MGTRYLRSAWYHKTSQNLLKCTFELVKQTAQYLIDKVAYKPKIGIICGSGLGALAEGLFKPRKVPYKQIPNFPVSTVQGHPGQLVFGELSSVPVVCMQGRFHYYEGYPLWKCTLPVRVMKLLGATHLIISNAAGGLNKLYKLGDIMLIKDHINMLAFVGKSPLRGPNEDCFGPRFPSMYKIYNKNLIQMAKQAADEENLSDAIQEGIYTCVGGPNYETVAELKMLRMVGSDAVGMSTAHEVITATHCGLKVLAFSLISNICITEYDSKNQINHEEVITAGKMREEDLKRIVARVVDLIGRETLTQDD